LPFLGALNNIIYYRNNTAVEYQWLGGSKYMLFFIFEGYSGLFFSIEFIVSEYNYIIGLYSDDIEAFTIGGRNKQARIVYRGLYRQFYLIIIIINSLSVSSGFSNTV
jgi:hypothetical protein